jgi:hypothetical protein
MAHVGMILHPMHLYHMCYATGMADNLGAFYVTIQ